VKREKLEREALSKPLPVERATRSTGKRFCLTEVLKQPLYSLISKYMELEQKIKYTKCDIHIRAET
jgi:hypothetical protein